MICVKGCEKVCEVMQINNYIDAAVFAILSTYIIVDLIFIHKIFNKKTRRNKKWNKTKQTGCRQS